MPNFASESFAGSTASRTEDAEEAGLQAATPIAKEASSPKWAAQNLFLLSVNKTRSQ
jgi:hypothetical protein